MKILHILLPMIFCTVALGLLGINSSVGAAEETVKQDTITTNGPYGSTTTYSTTTTKEKVHKKHHEGLVGDTVGVTGKAVKTTIELPGKAVKETFKVLF